MGMFICFLVTVSAPQSPLRPGAGPLALPTLESKSRAAGGPRDRLETRLRFLCGDFQGI